MTFLISLLGHNPSLHLYKCPTNMYNLIYKIVIKHKILVRCNTLMHITNNHFKTLFRAICGFTGPKTPKIRCF